MSVDLTVYMQGLPDDLGSKWARAMAEWGMECKPASNCLTEGDIGFVPWICVESSQDASEDAKPVRDRAFEAGFELSVGPFDSKAYLVELQAGHNGQDDQAVIEAIRLARIEARFRTSSSRSPADLQLQWFAAATLAILADGVLEDPQAGRRYVGRAALLEAARQSRELGAQR